MQQLSIAPVEQGEVGVAEVLHDLSLLSGAFERI
jgi:hypothetical protein